MTRDKSPKDRPATPARRRKRRAVRPKPLPPPPSERGADEPFSLASLPFDVYQRHKLVQSVVEMVRGGRKRLSILHVGSGPRLLREFLPRDCIVVVDGDGGSGAVDLLGDSGQLPFRDAAFDIVVSTDGLGLVPPRRRPAYLRELSRVTGDTILVAAPFASAGVSEAESILETFLERRLRQEQPALAVHRELGLPARDRSTRSLARHVGPVAVVPNGNLNRWLLMKSLSSYLDADPQLGDLHRRVSAFYNRNAYHLDNSEPAYRHALVARRPPAGPLDSARLVTDGSRSTGVDFSPMAALMEATDLDLLREAYASVARLQEIVGDKDVQAARLAAQRDHRQRVIEELQEELARRQERLDELERQVAAAVDAEAEAERLRQAVGDGESRNAGLDEQLQAERAGAADLRRQLEQFAEHGARLDGLLSRTQEHGDGMAAHARGLEELLDRKDRDSRNLITHAENLAERMRWQTAEHARHAGDLTALLRRQADGLEPRVEKLLGDLSRVTDLAETLRSRDEEVRDVGKRLAQAVEERDEALGRAGELEGRVEALQQERGKDRQDYDSLTATLAARGNRIAGLERHAENVQALADRRAARIQVLEEQTGALKALVDRSRKHHEQSSEKLGREREKLLAEISGAREVLGARDKRVKALESHAKLLEERGNRLGRQIGVLRKVVDTRQQMLGELNAQADRFQRESATLRSELDAARDSARESAVQLGARNRDLDEARRRIEGQLRAASGLKTKLEGAERRIAQRDRAALEVSARLGVVSAQARKQEEELGRKDRQVSELRREVAALEVRLAEQEGRAEELAAAKGRAEQAVEAGRKSLRERSRHAADLSRKLRELRERPLVRLLRGTRLLRDPD